MNLEKTILKFGGVTAMADAIGVSRRTIYNWRADNEVPYYWIAFIEAELSKIEDVNDDEPSHYEIEHKVSKL